jgi:hypothetical protein
MRTLNMSLMVLAAVLASVPLARAAGSDCALGGFVTNKSKGAIQQLLAFSTNSTFFLTYAGAVTSGTSDCSSSGIVRDEYEQEIYVTVAGDGLLGDMARGEGEYLRSFAALMGCGGALYPAFAQWSQENVERYADAAASTPRAWVSAVRQDLAADPRLSGCTRLS